MTQKRTDNPRLRVQGKTGTVGEGFSLREGVDGSSFFLFFS